MFLEDSYAVGGAPDVAIPSLFYRELLYNIEHAVHHMAILRIALEADFPHVPLAEHSGVAYSTVQHRNQATN